MERDDPITRQLEAVLQDLRPEDGGTLADYIPELARMDPHLFGVALASVRGGIYRAGDTDALFTMQSVSKPFVYAMALDDLGLDAVLERMDVEPSGEAFNAISLEPGTGRPANPMINAGAILATSLLHAGDATERFGRILETMSAFAGRRLDVDEDVYRSELVTGDRNRALAYLMRGAGVLDGDVEAAVDTYFRQCAIRVTAVDVATMAATLANRGMHPMTGQRVVSEEVASQVLTVMATCGMYDYSGNWLLRVGLPAKSGVSGALMAASPDEFGIGLFSPRVDAFGNSVRGVMACKDLASRFELQMFRRRGRPAPALYSRTTDDLMDGRSGQGHGATVPDPRPGNVAIRALQGDICFADSEALLRSLDTLRAAGPRAERTIVVLDLRRVGRVSRAAVGILSGTARLLTDLGHLVAIVDDGDRTLVDGVQAVKTLDDALTWAGSRDA